MAPFLEPGERQQKAHAPPVCPIWLPVVPFQIPFLESQGDEDVGGCRDREKQMTVAHRRRGPESDQEACHHGMTDITVKAKRFEFNRAIWKPRRKEIDLPKSEQVEVVDQECGQEHDRPPEPEDGMQEPAARRIADVPDNGGDRPPLPEQKPKEEAADQDISAPLDRRRDESRARPP